MKVLKKVLVMLMFCALVFSSCSDNEDPKPAAQVTANAGADRKIQPGETIALDGSASRDSEGKALSYQWSVLSKPENSNPTFSNNAIVNPNFAADLEGVYQLELAVSSEHGSSKDVVAITVQYSPVILSDITTPTVLEDRIADPAIADYWANDDIGVNAALVVKPGVVIAFAEDAGLYLNEGGSLSAKGEAARKIRFTGKVNQQGYWRGILVFSNSSANEMIYSEILNAGSSDMVSGVKANITVGEEARLSVRNSLIDGGKGYGIHYMDGALITGFESNVISHNAGAALLLTADHVAKLDANSSFSNGNGRNVIEVTGSFLSGATEVVWKAFPDNTPYRFLGTILVQTGLKLSPGVTIEVSPGEHFEIGDGYLNAVGTQQKKIIITGVDKTASSWNGLVVYSRSNFNVLDHVEISYGGDGLMINSAKAGLFVSHDASLVIKNSVISHSGGYGIYVNGSEVTINADVATVNTFVSNALEAVHYQP